MPTESNIVCPKCGASIPLTETLAAPVIAAMKQRLESEAAAREQTVARREAELKAESERLRAAAAAVDEQVAAKLRTERASLEDGAKRKARAELSDELAKRDGEAAELREVLRQRDAKLEEARRDQADALRAKREYEDKAKEMDLAVQKRVEEGLAGEREKAKREAVDAERLKQAEKDKTIADLRTQLQDAMLRAERGSQQLQGEVQELDLERRLREAFPRDSVEPVPKGQFGGDALHRVLSPQGQPCGTILWESKRTKNWSPQWPDKLKQDQRAAKADLAVIVTQAMPAGIDTFGEVAGVWVTTPALAVPLAGALRLGLAEAAAARLAAEGQQDKMALLYQYLTGPQFRQRIEALLDVRKTMHDELAAERASIERIWAKRQKQIDRMLGATSGLAGDLQGIAGASIGRIEGLDLKVLEGPADGA